MEFEAGKPVYAWPLVNDWWTERCARKAVEDNAPENQNQARLRTESAQAEIVEMKRDEMRRLLVPIAEVEEERADCYSRIRSKLMAMVERGTNYLVGKKDKKAIRKELRRLIDEILEELRTDDGDDLEEAA